MLLVIKIYTFAVLFVLVMVEMYIMLINIYSTALLIHILDNFCIGLHLLS